MDANDFILSLAVVIIFLSLVNMSVVVFKIYEVRQELTGFASGYINLTLNTFVQVNMSRDVINWSSGAINLGELNATLFTNQSSPGVVLRGNWSGVNALAFVVENIGNTNVSLSVQAGKSASSFFGSASGTNQEYKFNVTNKEPGSCTGGATLGVWADVNTTSGGTMYCRQMDYDNSRDEVYIDLSLTVPYDVINIGIQLDTITVTADVV